MPKNILDVTIVVPTLGRTRESIDLHEVLHTLEPAPSKIIFIFQDTTDITEFRATGNCSEHCSVEISGRSAVLARNAGLALCETTYIAFIDDDCVPNSRDWLSTLTAPLSSSKVGLVTGPVFGWSNASGTVPWLTRAFLLLPPFLEPIGRPDSGISATAHTVAGGNFAARTEDLKVVGGFSTRFGSPSLYEETELAIRVTRRFSNSIWFNSSAGVTHKQALHGGMRANSTHISEEFVLLQRQILLEEVYGRNGMTDIRIATFRLTRKLFRPVKNIKKIFRTGQSVGRK